MHVEKNVNESSLYTVLVYKKNAGVNAKKTDEWEIEHEVCVEEQVADMKAIREYQAYLSLRSFKDRMFSDLDSSSIFYLVNGKIKFKELTTLKEVEEFIENKRMFINKAGVKYFKVVIEAKDVWTRKDEEEAKSFEDGDKHDLFPIEDSQVVSEEEEGEITLSKKRKLEKDCICHEDRNLQKFTCISCGDAYCKDCIIIITSIIFICSECSNDSLNIQKIDDSLNIQKIEEGEKNFIKQIQKVEKQRSVKCTYCNKLTIPMKMYHCSSCTFEGWVNACDSCYLQNDNKWTEEDRIMMCVNCQENPKTGAEMLKDKVKVECTWCHKQKKLNQIQKCETCYTEACLKC